MREKAERDRISSEQAAEARGVEIGEARGVAIGEARGTLKGEIRLMQRMLHLPQFSEADFAEMDLTSMQQLLIQLQAKFPEWT